MDGVASSHVELYVCHTKFNTESKKDVQQTANTKSTEQAVTSDNVKSEASIPPSQETPATKQSTKAPEPPVQQQAPPAPAVITNEIPKETPTDDIEVINTERVEASPQAPARDERRSLEAAETRSKGEEKPSKTNLRKFFKLGYYAELSKLIALYWFCRDRNTEYKMSLAGLLGGLKLILLLGPH
ncbi:UNVERIFIED_CONTAM: hypothetical protein K2H54_067552 [Gekko kuhli]